MHRRIADAVDAASRARLEALASEPLSADEERFLTAAAERLYTRAFERRNALRVEAVGVMDDLAGPESENLSEQDAERYAEFVADTFGAHVTDAFAVEPHHQEQADRVDALIELQDGLALRLADHGTDYVEDRIDRAVQMRRLVGSPHMVEFSDALLWVHSLVTADLEDGRTPAPLLLRIYSSVEGKLQRVERHAAGRPVIAFGRGVSTNATWAKADQTIRARYERDAAFREGRTSAASNPGQDVFARQGRYVYVDRYAGDGQALAGARPRAESDRRDVQRLEAAKESPGLDDVQFANVAVEELRNVGLTASELRSPERGRLSAKRKQWYVAVYTRGATLTQAASYAQKDKRGVSRVLAQHFNT